jgi:hypothetical protein
MTAVDALDTLIIMGLKDEAECTSAYARSPTFDQASVKNFEITIRLPGGLLGAQMTGDPRFWPRRIRYATAGVRLPPACRCSST